MNKLHTVQVIVLPAQSEQTVQCASYSVTHTKWTNYMYTVQVIT